MSTRKQRRTRNQLFRQWSGLGSEVCVTCGRKHAKTNNTARDKCALLWSQTQVTAQIEKLERRIAAHG